MPLRLERLPEAVPRALALFLLTTAIAKFFKLPTLCGEDPFEGPNLLMMPVEFFVAVWLWLPGAGRRRAALFVALLMPGAVVYLTYMHHRGFDVRSCGCLGPVELPFATHVAVLVVLCATAAVVFLREETRADRLSRVFR